MRTRQLVDLRNDVRKLADVENATQFIPDADLNEYISQGWTRIYGLLCTNGENYYLSQATFTTVSGQDTYYTTGAVGKPAGTTVLPTDLWRVKGLDVQIQSNGRWANAQRFQFEQRNDYQDSSWSWPTCPLFDYEGSGLAATIRFIPVPNASSVRLYYFPAAVRMSADSDVIDGGNGWELYAIRWAARECAKKDENYELIAQLNAEMAEMVAAIEKEAASRNAGIAPKVRRSPRYKRGWGTHGGGGSWGWGGP